MQSQFDAILGALILDEEMDVNEDSERAEVMGNHRGTSPGNEKEPKANLSAPSTSVAAPESGMKDPSTDFIVTQSMTSNGREQGEPVSEPLPVPPETPPSFATPESSFPVESDDARAESVPQPQAAAEIVGELAGQHDPVRQQAPEATLSYVSVSWPLVAVTSAVDQQPPQQTQQYQQTGEAPTEVSKEEYEAPPQMYDPSFYHYQQYQQYVQAYQHYLCQQPQTEEDRARLEEWQKQWQAYAYYYPPYYTFPGHVPQQPEQPK